MVLVIHINKCLCLQIPMTRTDSLASEEVSAIESDYEGELDPEKVRLPAS